MSLQSKCLAFSCSVVLALTGCSEQQVRYPVAGKVVIDGEPVTKGSIQFVPAEGRPFASRIFSDGSFRLVEASMNQQGGPEGIAPGKYRIGVSSSEVVDEDKGEVLKHIPGRYADFTKSGLEVEINSPNEDLLIELTWEGAKELEEEQDVQEDVENDGAEQEGPQVTEATSQE